MKEILPGVFHWTTFHEGIAERVHSYYIEAINPAILIDPRVPAQGVAWFNKHARPEHSFLTNRHHYRHSGQFAAIFGTQIWCHNAGLHEFTHGEIVIGFDHGDLLPGGVKALEVGVLCPEETAFQLNIEGGILSFGDAIVRGYRGRLEFVPDELMGEDPEAVKEGLLKIFRHHLRRRFDHMLFAHGYPLVGNGKERLQEFVERFEKARPSLSQRKQERPPAPPPYA